MADFQELGIKIEAIDNASAKLQKVVDLLERIKKLSGGKIIGGGTSGGGGRTASTNREVQSLKQLDSIYNKIRVSALGATNAQIRYDNAVNNATATSLRYEQAQRKLALAQERLKAANANMSSILATDPQRNSNGKVTSSAQRTYDAQVAAAKQQVVIAQNDVISATEQEELAYKSLINAQNSEITASNNLQKEKEREVAADKKSAEQKKKYRKQVLSTTKSLVNFAAKTTLIVGTVRKLSQALFSAVEESGAFVENLNLFGVTFGENYQETLDWALDFAKNLGVASSEIVRFTGLFKQLSDSIGIAADMGTEMSQVLTQLGYDRQKLSLYTVMCIEKPCEHTNVWCEQYQIAC